MYVCLHRWRKGIGSILQCARARTVRHTIAGHSAGALPPSIHDGQARPKRRPTRTYSTVRANNEHADSLTHLAELIFWVKVLPGVLGSSMLCKAAEYPKRSSDWLIWEADVWRMITSYSSRVTPCTATAKAASKSDAVCRHISRPLRQSSRVRIRVFCLQIVPLCSVKTPTVTKGRQNGSPNYSFLFKLDNSAGSENKIHRSSGVVNTVHCSTSAFFQSWSVEHGHENADMYRTAPWMCLLR